MANSLDALQHARRNVGPDSKNVLFLRLDVYSDSWASVELNPIDVVFVDALHDFWSVMSDVWHALQTGARWLVFHDFGDPNDFSRTHYGNQVKEVVQS